MKRILCLLVAGFLLCVGCDNNQTDSTAEVGGSQKQQSYALGYNIGNSLLKQDVDFVLGDFKEGFSDGLKGDGKYSDEELRDFLTALNASVMKKVKAKREESSKQNIAAAEAFFANNRERDDVIETESGLQYSVLTRGNGVRPEPYQNVLVKYRGELLDGTVFDSSEKTGGPISLNISQVIPGWTEALQLMSVGSVWKLYIPSDLAYGARGSRDVIGPDAALIFEVELVDIVNE